MPSYMYMYGNSKLQYYLVVMETALPLLLLEGADDAATELKCDFLSAGRFSIPLMGGRSNSSTLSPPSLLTPPLPPSTPALPVELLIPLLVFPPALLVLLVSS